VEKKLVALLLPQLNILLLLEAVVAAQIFFPVVDPLVAVVQGDI
jgi:hypothetical protein